VNRARQLRLDKGLTLTAVAKETGVARLTIARVEDQSTSDASIQAPILKALGDFYGVPASSLLSPARAAA
jgi:transcriptional regulator with XRE-family HTH domain